VRMDTPEIIAGFDELRIDIDKAIEDGIFPPIDADYLMAALVGSIIAVMLDLGVLRDSGVIGLATGVQALLCGVFAGFVAHDTQKIKQMYRAHGPRDNLAVVGALKLYLDFVNLLLAALRLLGGYR